MNQRWTEEELHDYVSGRLSPEDRRRIEQSMEQDPLCRETVEEMRRLREATGAIPRSIEPSRDLWPGIAAELKREPVVRGNFRSQRRESHWLAGAGWVAAAVLFISTGVLLYGLLVPGAAPAAARGAGEDPIRGVAPGSVQEVSLREYRAAEREYAGVVEQLNRVLEARRKDLSPQTVAVVEHNLAIINQAIEEARAALERDATDPRAGRMFASLYERKIELMKTASRLPEGT